MNLKSSQDAIEAVNNGYTDLKIKVGNDSALDFKRIIAIRNAVGNEINIRLDDQIKLEPKDDGFASTSTNFDELKSFK